VIGNSGLPGRQKEKKEREARLARGKIEEKGCSNIICLSPPPPSSLKPADAFRFQTTFPIVITPTDHEKEEDR